MKKYQIEVNYTLTAYVEIEADNEEEAIQEAYEECADKTIGELREWDSSTEVKQVTERCDYCYKEFDVDTEPLVDYDGGRYCPDCKKELEECEEDDC